MLIESSPSISPLLSIAVIGPLLSSLFSDVFLFQCCCYSFKSLAQDRWSAIWVSCFHRSSLLSPGAAQAIMQTALPESSCRPKHVLQNGLALMLQLHLLPPSIIPIGYVISAIVRSAYTIGSLLLFRCTSSFDCTNSTLLLLLLVIFAIVAKTTPAGRIVSCIRIICL